MRHDNGLSDQNLKQNQFILELNNKNKLSCLKYYDKKKDEIITILPNYKIKHKGKQYSLEECLLYHNEGLITPDTDKSTNNTKTKPKPNKSVEELKRNMIQISELRQIETSQHKLNIKAIGNDSDVWNVLRTKLKPRRNVENKKKIHVNLVNNRAYKNR